MTKKTLDESNIVNELTGQSAFFQKQQSPPPAKTTAPKSEAAKEQEILPANPEFSASANQVTEPINEEIKKPRYRDTTVSLYQSGLIEIIRRAVRQLGKEAATYRFTLEEKRALADIVYTYKSRGVRTSENEITRIAIHSLAEDYKTNGETSILARVLARLNE